MTRARAIELRMIAIPLVQPFRTSFGVEADKVITATEGQVRRVFATLMSELESRAAV